MILGDVIFLFVLGIWQNKVRSRMDVRGAWDGGKLFEAAIVEQVSKK